MSPVAWNEDPNSVDLAPYRRNLADSGRAQATYNRPSTYGPFGQSVVGADGSVNTSFSGPFNDLNNSLTTQAASVASNPIKWDQFGALGMGEDAGRQTAQAAYDQSLSRLNPFWQKSEKSLRTNLFQSGMADSDAGDSTLNEFGRSRNDAYAGAMANAMQQGMGAQQSAFQGNLASRQQQVANALRGQLQPYEEMQGMQGFLAQPEYNRDNSMMVRDAAYNQMAPVSAWADKERAMTDRVNQTQPGLFQDNSFDANAGGGERRKEAWETLDPGTREFFLNFGKPMHITTKDKGDKS